MLKLFRRNEHEKEAANLQKAREVLIRFMNDWCNNDRAKHTQEKAEAIPKFEAAFICAETNGSAMRDGQNILTYFDGNPHGDEPNRGYRVRWQIIHTLMNGYYQALGIGPPEYSMWYTRETRETIPTDKDTWMKARKIFMNLIATGR